MSLSMSLILVFSSLAPWLLLTPGSHGGPPLFTTGMEVYVRKENAWFYGIIKKVDEYHKRCRVSFDGVDDVWASFKVLGPVPDRN